MLFFQITAYTNSYMHFIIIFTVLIIKEVNFKNIGVIKGFLIKFNFKKDHLTSYYYYSSSSPNTTGFPDNKWFWKSNLWLIYSKEIGQYM